MRTLVLIAVVLLAAGCAREGSAESPSPIETDTHSSIESAVLARLKDPQSAMVKVTGEYKRRGERLVCGNVNAKNALGAYVGDRVFLAWLDSDGGIARISVPENEDASKLAASFCSDLDGSL